jgi:hypothetical protein
MHTRVWTSMYSLTKFEQVQVPMQVQAHLGAGARRKAHDWRLRIHAQQKQNAEQHVRVVRGAGGRGEPATRHTKRLR